MSIKNREIIEIECPKCGCNQSYKNVSKYSEAGECVACGALTYYNKIHDYDLPAPKIKVECPYCHSKNTKKISKVSKTTSVAIFGILSLSKATKEWHCNGCQSDF